MKLTDDDARFGGMSFTIKVAYVDIVVAYTEWEPKRLAKMSVQTVYRPEKTFPKLDVFSSEAGIPYWTSVQSDLEGHPYDQAT